VVNKFINRKIGFFYINDPNWIGGLDYIINAVNSLNYLETEKQPDIEILVSEDVNLEELSGRITYSKFNFHVLPLKIKHTLSLWLTNRYRWEYVYPFPKGKVYDNLFWGMSDRRKIYWIPDFQEEYFPHYFEVEILEKRRKMRAILSKQNKSMVVFSSRNALNDFKQYYGPEIKAKTKVLQFANPDKWEFDFNFTQKTLKRYNLKSNEFFICPNQMWEHKNHIIVLEALREGLKINQNLKVVFCGKEHDPRKPSFANELKLMGKDLVDNGNVYFLGYLPKNEQMCLINESIALIQPSKFEGWSTTIEDGIAFGKQIIASDLLVNQEQLTDKGLYFNPNDYKELSGILLNLSEVCGSVNYNQELRVKEFAHKLITLSK